jgi:hypothetical protein
MSRNVIEKLPEGGYRMNGPAVFSCGCANVVPEARQKLSMAGVPDVPIVMTTTSQHARKFIKQIGLDHVAPSLRKGTHSVLYNPDTGAFVNLLKSPQTEAVYENIFKVARGL